MSIKTEFALLVNGKVVVVGGEALKEMLDYGTAVLPTGRVVCINNKVFPLYKLYGEQSLGDWFKEEIIDKSLGTLKEDKHMTNEELAKKCNIANTTLSGYETGYRQPTFDTLLIIAKECGFELRFVNEKNEILTIKNIERKEL